MSLLLDYWLANRIRLSVSNTFDISMYDYLLIHFRPFDQRRLTLFIKHCNTA